MKKLIFVLLLIPALCAAYTLPQVFNNATGAKNQARSVTYDVSAYNTKSIFVYGKYSSGGFWNLSGSVRVKCGYSKLGNYTTCKQSQLTGTPNVILTSNGFVTWRDAVQWIKVEWVRSKRAVNVWLTGISN